MSELNGHSPRYGIYFAPSPGAPLHSLGSQWLGRDAATGESLDPALSGDMRRDEWLKVTESPRRYGFHATLKPPFRLAEGAAFEDLRTALRDFAATHESFEAPPLGVGTLGHFLALTLSEPYEKLVSLAADAVGEFEKFRAPASEEELAQRLRGRLAPREREHILRWGYPYVLDTWKFHMSLTGSLPPPALPPLEEHLRHRFAPATQQPLLIDSVCIFHESHPGALFHVVDRVYLRTL